MSDFLQQKPLILASSSAIRSKLLASLGLKFQIIPSTCNEDAIKQNFSSDRLIELGYALARHKAFEVSQRYPEHYVIAADQLCILDNTLFDKPLNHQTAIKHLQLLQGKTHQQVACLCIARNGNMLWQHHESAALKMRSLSQRAIESYLQAEKPYHSCGAYQYETMGKWLFSEIEGREETILGLPLIPLVEALLSLCIVRFD